MKLVKGDQVPQFLLKDLSGQELDSQSLLGTRYMLSFYRYASCPFCNLRISFLMGLHDELALHNQFIGVFQSTEDDMKKYVNTQRPVFPICSDEHRVYYKKFGVESSLLAYIIGALKIKQLVTAWKKGFKISRSMGPKTSVPADFLIDEAGNVQVAYYGKDISDHLDLDVVEAFFSKINHSS